MTIAEVLTEWEARRAHEPGRDYAGGLTQADVDELLEWDD